MYIGLLEAALETFEDKFMYGGKMLIIGMGIVFAVLAILWACLELLKRCMAHFSNHANETKSTEKISVAPTPTPTPMVAPANADDDEIVAVLAAAIAAAEAEYPGLRFRAVSFKRIH